MAHAIHLQHMRHAVTLEFAAPTPSEWGPPLWKMLHWLAERVGCQESILLDDDEITLWKRIFKSLAVILPCNQCREHYKTYFQRFDLAKIGTLHGTLRCELIRRWLYELHDYVNCLKHIKSPPFEALTGMYREIEFPTERATFYKVLERAQRQNIVKHNDVIQFKTLIVTLFGLYKAITI